MSRYHLNLPTLANHARRISNAARATKGSTAVVGRRYAKINTMVSLAIPAGVVAYVKTPIGMLLEVISVLYVVEDMKLTFYA
jgi:hypothetical protein